MQHFIYKTTCSSGKYYIGRHSTTNVNDNYFGSGKWIRSIKDKSTLTREILEFCTEETLKQREEYYLKENVGKEVIVDVVHDFRCRDVLSVRVRGVRLIFF